jgi:hypothetical protein
MVSRDTKALYKQSKERATRKQKRLKKLLSNSSINPAIYNGILECTLKQCGRDRCIVGCAYGDRRRRMRQLPKVHELLERIPGPVFEVRLARSGWARRFKELSTASVLAAKQMTRRALDDLYYSSVVAVGTFKAAAEDFTDVDRCLWVCGVHLLVAGVDEASASGVDDVNRRSNLTPYRRPILTPLSDVYGR